MAPEGGGIGDSSQSHLWDGFPRPCAAPGRDFSRMQWHLPFPLHIQSPGHSVSASPEVACVSVTGASSHPALSCSQSRLCVPGTQLCLPQLFLDGIMADGDIC